MDRFLVHYLPEHIPDHHPFENKKIMSGMHYRFVLHHLVVLGPWGNYLSQRTHEHPPLLLWITGQNVDSGSDDPVPSPPEEPTTLSPIPPHNLHQSQLFPLLNSWFLPIPFHICPLIERLIIDPSGFNR